MATERLRYKIEAAWSGGRATAKAKSDIKEVGDAAETTTAKLSNWRSALPAMAAVGAGLGGVAVAARGVWSALEGGAALLETERKFDRLAMSIGTTGDALRDNLSESVGLLMTQAEQMGLATQLMQLGLAQTSEEVTRLSTVTAELGIDIGQLALTLTNQTTMRFDQMNMRVEGFAERIERLKASGMSADQAFKWAFIQQAEAQVDLLGRRSETAAGQLDMLKNATTQAWEVFQMEFANAVVSQFSDIEGAAQSLATDLARVAGLIASIAGWGGWSAFGDLGASMKFAFDWAAGGFSGVGQSQAVNINKYGFSPEAGRYGGAGYGTPLTTADLTYNPPLRSTAMTAGKATALKDSMMDQVAIQREIRDTYQDIEKAGVQAFGGVASSVNQAEQALRGFTAASGDLFSRLRSGGEFNLAEEVFKIGDELGFSAGELADLGVASGLFGQDEANKWLSQVAQIQNARMLAQSGMKGADLWAAASGFEPGADLAREFFAGLDETEARMGLDTTQMELDLDMFLQDVQANKTLTIALELTPAYQALEEAVADSIDASRYGG